MKKTFFLFLLGALLTMNGKAQNPGNENIIQYRSFSSQLDAKSDTAHRKSFYKDELDLKQGEKLFVKYSSPEYAVALFIRNMKGDTLGGVDIPKYFSTTGSHLAFLFRPPSAGHYQVLLTSKDSLEKGKFTVHYAIFDSVEKAFDEEWSFCEKLNYLMQHSATDFQFITGPKTAGFSLTNTRTTDYYLEDAAKCEIEYFTSDVYVSTFLEKMNLERCIQKMKELDYEIRKCISPQWKITERRIEEISEINKSRFERETDYRLYGKPVDDHNDVHEKLNLKYSVRLMIEKNISGDYDLKIVLE
jgi:hypothetical protein